MFQHPFEDFFCAVIEVERNVFVHSRKIMKHNGYTKDHKRLNKVIDLCFEFFSLNEFMILVVALESKLECFNDFLVQTSSLLRSYWDRRSN